MYLGIDLGTSAVKTILVDHEQRVVASRSQSLTVASPHPGYSEQDPGQWIDATFATLDALKADHPRELAAVDGIGLSGQMHGSLMTLTTSTVNCLEAGLGRRRVRGPAELRGACR